MGRNSRDVAIPIPKYFWKVIYNEKTLRSIAVISINNPFQNVSSLDIFCKDISDQVSWIMWYPKDISIGYGFCCLYEDFRVTVKNLPGMNVRGLLE